MPGMLPCRPPAFASDTVRAPLVTYNPAAALSGQGWGSFRASTPIGTQRKDGSTTNRDGDVNFGGLGWREAGAAALTVSRCGTLVLAAAHRPMGGACARQEGWGSRASNKKRKREGSRTSRPEGVDVWVGGVGKACRGGRSKHGMGCWRRKSGHSDKLGGGYAAVEHLAEAQGLQSRMLQSRGAVFLRSPAGAP